MIGFATKQRRRPGDRRSPRTSAPLPSQPDDQTPETPGHLKSPVPGENAVVENNKMQTDPPATRLRKRRRPDVQSSDTTPAPVPAQQGTQAPNQLNKSGQHATVNSGSQKAAPIKSPIVILTRPNKPKAPGQDAIVDKNTQQVESGPAPAELPVFKLPRLSSSEIHAYWFPPGRYVHMSRDDNLIRYDYWFTHWACFLIGLGAPYQILSTSSDRAGYWFLLAAEDDYLLAAKVQSTMDLSVYREHPHFTSLFTASELFEAVRSNENSPLILSPEGLEIVRPEQLGSFRPNEWMRYGQPMGNTEMAICTIET